MGYPAITSAQYRALYCRPVKTFHEKLIGHAVSKAEWSDVNAQFVSAYAINRKTAKLAHDALACLAEARRLGIGQSLLSMMQHEQLLIDVAHYGVTAFFSAVDGDRNGTGASKVSSLRRHLAQQQILPQSVIVIGDTVDEPSRLRRWARGASWSLQTQLSTPLLLRRSHPRYGRLQTHLA